MAVNITYTKDDLYSAVPDFIDKHFPKNKTAAQGGEPTPGRGDAMAAIAMFIAELPTGEYTNQCKGIPDLE